MLMGTNASIEYKWRVKLYVYKNLSCRRKTIRPSDYTFTQNYTFRNVATHQEFTKSFFTYVGSISLLAGLLMFELPK